jgi:hypothetical protein
MLARLARHGSPTKLLAPLNPIQKKKGGSNAALFEICF